jgi:hypothetical protein
VSNAGTVKGLFEEALPWLDEAQAEYRDGLQEGEIGDALKKDEPMDRLRRMHDAAHRRLESALWDDKYPTHNDKRKRQLDVLADWTKELKALDTGRDCPECGTHHEEETPTMEYKDITAADLEKNCPELVAKLKGTDETSRLREEANTHKAKLTESQATIAAKDAELATLRAEKSARLREDEIKSELKDAFPGIPETDTVVFSAEFKEQLSTASDKASRAKIIAHTKRFVDRLHESTGAAPFAEIPNPDAAASAGKAPTFHEKFAKA